MNKPDSLDLRSHAELMNVEFVRKALGTIPARRIAKEKALGFSIKARLHPECETLEDARLAIVYDIVDGKSKKVKPNDPIRSMNYVRTHYDAANRVWWHLIAVRSTRKGRERLHMFEYSVQLCEGCLKAGFVRVFQEGMEERRLVLPPP